MRFTMRRIVPLILCLTLMLVSAAMLSQDAQMTELRAADNAWEDGLRENRADGRTDEGARGARQTDGAGSRTHIRSSDVDSIAIEGLANRAARSSNPTRNGTQDRRPAEVGDRLGADNETVYFVG